MFRAAFTYTPALLPVLPGRALLYAGIWRVVRCYRVKDGVCGPVKVRDKGMRRQRLMILTPKPIEPGTIADPMEVLENYLETL